MKNYLTLIIFIFLISCGDTSEEDYKTENERVKKIENDRKVYMDKINSISLFGVHFQDNVRKLAFYSTQEVTDRNGLYVGNQIKKFPGLNDFNIEIIPPVKNENFVKYYAYYNPFSYEVFAIAGELPKKISDFLDEKDKKNAITDIDFEEAFKKCKEYLEPFVSSIDDGIKNKTNLVADNNNFERINNSVRGFSFLYRMNSGLNDNYWYFDGFPEGYFGINTKKYITEDNYREPIIKLEATCDKYSFNQNLIIILSQDVLKDYMNSDLVPLFYKKVSEKKLREEKEMLEYKKNSIDKSGLQ